MICHMRLLYFLIRILTQPGKNLLARLQRIDFPVDIQLSKIIICSSCQIKNNFVCLFYIKRIVQRHQLPTFMKPGNPASKTHVRTDRTHFRFRQIYDLPLYLQLIGRYRTGCSILFPAIMQPERQSARRIGRQTNDDNIIFSRDEHFTFISHLI